VLLSIPLGVVLSYVISISIDRVLFRNEILSLPKVLARSVVPLALSLTARLCLIAILTQSIHQLLLFVDRYLSTVPLSLGFSTVASSALVAFVPHQLVVRAKRSAGKSLTLTPWLRAIMKLERVSWPAIVAELEMYKAEVTNRIWSHTADRPLVFILFEEQKTMVVRYHFKWRHELGWKTWLYLGLLAGNNVPRRAEALIYVYGSRWLDRELGLLRDGGRKTAIPVREDKRKMDPAWLANPPIHELFASQRECDRLIAELLSNLTPPAVRDTVQ